MFCSLKFVKIQELKPSQQCFMDPSLINRLLIIFLEMFTTPSGQMTPFNTASANFISPAKALTARHQVALELLQTERNYVDILNTILKVSCFFSQYSEMWPVEATHTCTRRCVLAILFSLIYSHVYPGRISSWCRYTEMSKCLLFHPKIFHPKRVGKSWDRRHRPKYLSRFSTRRLFSREAIFSFVLRALDWN